MATKIYGTVNPDTGELLTSRATESPYNVPKIESVFEPYNTGFGRTEVSDRGLWDWWSEQVTFISDNPDEPIMKTPEAVTTIKKALPSFNMVTILAVALAAIVVMPRILPIRS